MSKDYDFGVFQNILSHTPTSLVWSDRQRTKYFLDFEAALAKVQARLNIIPEQPANAIIAACSDWETFIDWDLFRRQTEIIGYPVLGLVQQLVAHVDKQSPPGESWGQFSHYGATTQDVTDTASVLQIRDSLDIFQKLLNDIINALRSICQTHRATPMPGRSHLQQAVPISVGFKFARLLATFLRHMERLDQLRGRILVLEFSGAAGTLATLSPDGKDEKAFECQNLLADALNLQVPDISWHAERDNIAEYGFFCNFITGTCAKFATDLMLGMQNEVNEMREPYVPHRGSSSTMPQKRNPISSAYVKATAATVRQLSATLSESIVGDHERSTGPWEIEFIVLPQISILTAACLQHTLDNLQGLEIDQANMRANLDISQGGIVSEAVMMGLGPTLGRQRAHDLVYELFQEAQKTDRPLVDLLSENAEIRLPRTQLEDLCSVDHYLGLSVTMTEKILQKVV